DVLRQQPTVVRVPAPCKVFGDVHGQLRSLLLLFASFGFPSHLAGDVQGVSYIFNGDFVDRGVHQLEVVALLFALKLVYPERIYLLRG
ncbi:Serine/threonine-phosphatase, partial [Emiliania huxleyi CCMP1516]|uniref:protein-serine/threonine phosphatase n=2 Tax=Emiliania huxleyi TaxID=2903 RepID=A0A0D3KLZ7_EMIH1